MRSAFGAAVQRRGSDAEPFSVTTACGLRARAREAEGALERTTFRGVLLATTAMIVRNGVLLAVLAFDAFLAGVAALAAMAVLGVLQVSGSLAQRELGELGFYAVSLAGGFVSSASAVASAGAVAAHGDVSAHVAGIGAVLATLVSAAVNWPIAARVSGDRVLARRLLVPILLVVAVGLAGALVQRFA